MTDEGLRQQSVTEELVLGLEVEGFTSSNILKSNNLTRRIYMTLDKEGVNTSDTTSYQNKPLEIRIVRTIWDGD